MSEAGGLKDLHVPGSLRSSRARRRSRASTCCSTRWRSWRSSAPRCTTSESWFRWRRSMRASSSVTRSRKSSGGTVTSFLWNAAAGHACQAPPAAVLSPAHSGGAGSPCTIDPFGTHRGAQDKPCDGHIRTLVPSAMPQFKRSRRGPVRQGTWFGISCFMAACSMGDPADSLVLGSPSRPSWEAPRNGNPPAGSGGALLRHPACRGVTR